MKPTIKDVAREAGVSIATVSRVINGQDKVRDTTKKRIEEAIQKLDFKPDLIARTMVRKESRVIGLIVPTLTNDYWAALSEVIQNTLWEMGYTLMLCTVHNDEANKGAAYLKTFAERKIDGIIIGSLNMENKGTHELIEWFLRSGIPIVTFDQTIPGAGRITGNNIQGAMDAVQHLIKLGHRKIAYIHGSEAMNDREIGYRKALALSGIEYEENRVVRTYHDRNSGYLAAKELLKRGIDFSAIFCWNDSLALGAMRALQENGIKIPQEVSLVGYDNTEGAYYSNPALTTVDLPAEKIGKSLVELLLKSINNVSDDSMEKCISYQLKLVVRESTVHRDKSP